MQAKLEKAGIAAEQVNCLLQSLIAHVVQTYPESGELVTLANVAQEKAEEVERIIDEVNTSK